VVLSDALLFTYSRAALNFCPFVCVIGHMEYSRLGITDCLSFVVLSDMQHYFYGYNTINLVFYSILI